MDDILPGMTHGKSVYSSLRTLINRMLQEKANVAVLNIWSGARNEKRLK